MTWKFESGKSTVIEGVVEFQDAGGVQGDCMIGDVECDDDNDGEDSLEEDDINQGDGLVR